MTKTQYNTIHQWLKRHYTKTGVCETCGKKCRTHWSTKTGDYVRENRMEWQELCPKCHDTYDTVVLGKMSSQERGRILGKSYGRLNGVNKGFAANRELARVAGQKGGRISRRGKSKG